LKNLSFLIISLFIFVLFGCYTLSPPLPASTTTKPPIQYWEMNVIVTNRLLGTSSEQKAFFFRDLRSMEALTGFPRDDAHDASSTSYRWNEHLYNVPPYVEQMIAVMRREGFGAAFVLTEVQTTSRGI